MGRLQILGSILNSIKKRLGLASSNSTEITNFIPVSENPTNYLPGLKFVEVADEQRKHYSALLVQEKYNSRKILQELKNTTPASSSHAELPSTPPAKRPRSSQ